MYEIRSKQSCAHPPDERFYQPADSETNTPEDYYCLICNEQLPIPEPDFDLISKEENLC